MYIRVSHVMRAVELIFLPGFYVLGNTRAAYYRIGSTGFNVRAHLVQLQEIVLVELNNKWDMIHSPPPPPPGHLILCMCLHSIIEWPCVCKVTCKNTV